MVGSSRIIVSRVREEDAGELDAAALTAGEGAQRLIEDAVGKREVVGDGRRFGLGRIAAERFEPLGEVRVLAHRAGGHRGILRTHREGCLVHAERERPEPAGVEDPRAGEHLGVARARVLREVAELAGAIDLAGGGQQVAREHLRERRLAGAVAADETDLVAVRDAERYVGHQHAGAYADFDFVHGEHSGRPFRSKGRCGRMASHPVYSAPAWVPVPARTCNPAFRTGRRSARVADRGRALSDTTIRSVTDMAVAVSIEPAAIAATPGVPVEAVVSIRNDSQIVEEYALSAVGPGGGYVTLVPDRVSVYPGRTETVTARILVPRSPSVLAGELDVAIQITPTMVSVDDADANADDSRTTVGEVAELVITVEEFAAVGAEIVPKVSRSRGRKRVRIAIDNNGNAPIAASLIGAGTERLAVQPRDPEVAIDPGRAQFVIVSLVPRRRIWRGQAASHPYSVTVTPSAG